MVAEFLEQRIEAADVVSALARDERQLLYLALHSANLGVHTHGALIDGYLVTALNDVKFNGHAVNDVVEIEKFLFGAEKADEIVARAERDNGDLGVLVAVCAVDNLIEGAVSAAGIEAQLLTALCTVLNEFDAVVLLLGYINFVIESVLLTDLINWGFIKPSAFPLPAAGLITNTCFISKQTFRS